MIVQKSKLLRIFFIFKHLKMKRILDTSVKCFERYTFWECEKLLKNTRQKVQKTLLGHFKTKMYLLMYFCTRTTKSSFGGNSEFLS
ncbi:hypothetical protein COL38_30300 [Bacillus toyonensis]|nr:hypothetical protein COL38_30300 [Bacillus toyonensis]PGA96623.1 hypothetical protein COL98_31595 [Bacillus toyonensis]